MNTYQKIRKIITTDGKAGFAGMVVLALIAALLEVSGVASIMPLMSLIANPSVIEANLVLAYFYHELGFTNSDQFMIFLGLIVLALVVLSAVLRGFNTYATLSYIHNQEFKLGIRLFDCYLSQPYKWFLNRHSADMGSKILSEVNVVVTQAMLPLLILISQSFSAIALLTLLLFINYKISLITGVVVGGVYIVLFRIAKFRVGKMGKASSRANSMRFTVVSEAIGAIKEIKCSNTEMVYLKRFANEAEAYANNQTYAKAFAQLPRFGMEAFAFGGMVSLLVFMMMGEKDVTNVLPVLAVFALAGYKLMPALQQVYGAASQLRFAKESVDKLNNDLDILVTQELVYKVDHEQIPRLKKSIELKGVCFRYPLSNRDVLKSLDITIPASASVAFVGGTGSGKTTTIDIILGLLELDAGKLLVDQIEITPKNRSHWQGKIGYVPQQIFLLDDTIESNIVFGFDNGVVDAQALHEAARIACLDDFVNRELPDGYQTKIGERGVRLSGGQRQRIGIARALYRRPELLVLDEATSALDNKTEAEIMSSLKNLKDKITTISVAHRLTTIKDCDIIFYLDQGELRAQGCYEDLLARDEGFRLLALKAS